MATLDGEQVDVPAGSAVAVEGPVRRKFEATESPTTLIVVGGTPSKAYEVGDWEYYHERTHQRSAHWPSLTNASSSPDPPLMLDPTPLASLPTKRDPTPPLPRDPPPLPNLSPPPTPPRIA